VEFKKKGDQPMETSKAEKEPMMKAEPQKEHKWLQRLVGEWTYESEMSMESGKSSEKFKGTEKVRSLGELWIVAEGQGEMPGSGSVTTMLTLGYDPHNKRYVGTWIGSMMTYLWIYESGTLDAYEKVLTLEAEGPHMTVEGKTMKYKDVIELKSDDHRVLRGLMLGDDGKWQQFMTTNYWRKR
jgi:Protein of unknown function (DUF1579)